MISNPVNMYWQVFTACSVWGCLGRVVSSGHCDYFKGEKWNDRTYRNREHFSPIFSTYLFASIGDMRVTSWNEGITTGCLFSKGYLCKDGQSNPKHKADKSNQLYTYHAPQLFLFLGYGLQNHLMFVLSVLFRSVCTWGERRVILLARFSTHDSKRIDISKHFRPKRRLIQIQNKKFSHASVTAKSYNE